MRLYTMGFAGKSAEEFFETLKARGIRCVVDVRLRPDSHLAGFARSKHLVYFLREICDAAYEHRPELAPTEDLLKGFRNGDTTWDSYRQSYIQYLEERLRGSVAIQNDSCLLCSESEADHCHRRLAAEYIADICPVVEVVHL